MGLAGRSCRGRCGREEGGWPAVAQLGGLRRRTVSIRARRVEGGAADSCALAASPPLTASRPLHALPLQGVAAYSFAPVFEPGGCFVTPANAALDCHFWADSPFTLKICPGNGDHLPAHTCQA